MTMKNPFTPTFGKVPPVLAGRNQLLDTMAEAFDNGPGDPSLSSILIGARGTGKTALLSCIADEAGKAGWVSANVICSPGMLDDILQRAAEAAADFVEPKTRRHISGVNIGQVLGIEWTLDSQMEPNWRSRMNALLGALAEHDVGLLITVDEVRADVDEMIQLAGVYQMFVREERKVALVMAGLPMQVTSLLSDDRSSYLRRSWQYHLGRIDDADVEFAYQKTAESAGKTFTDDALHKVVQAAEGFAYMMQLVGYWSWRASGDDAVLTAKHVDDGIRFARKSLTQGVLDTTYQELSIGDRRFLAAMLQTDGECRLVDVARAMGKGTNYASTYKARLAGQGIIGELPGGELRFELPYFREYVKGKLNQA